MMLYDLIEYKFDTIKKLFVKVCTHKYNIPKSIAYGLKEQLIQQRKSAKINESLYRFKIVLNGTKQYSNLFNKKI